MLSANVKVIAMFLLFMLPYVRTMISVEARDCTKGRVLSPALDLTEPEECEAPEGKANFLVFRKKV